MRRRRGEENDAADVKQQEEEVDSDEEEEDGEFLHIEEDDLVLLGLVAGDEGWRKDEWAEGVGGEGDWARLLQ